MTVEQLAAQLGVTVGEAIALCRASGIAVTAPDSLVSAADARRVRDVLEGRVPLPDPAARRSRSAAPGRPGGAFGVVAAIVIGILVLLGMGMIGLTALGGDTSIDVAAGDCFDADLLGGTVFGSGIERKPCSRGEFRAFAVLDLDEVFDEWPGAEAVQARGEARCPVLAEGRVETTGSFGSLYWFGPGDELAWDNERSHKIVCAVTND